MHPTYRDFDFGMIVLSEDCFHLTETGNRFDFYTICLKCILFSIDL